MKTCTFFGHRDCPEDIKPILKRVIIDLIENKSINKFIVGTEGKFDLIVQSVLSSLDSNTYNFNYSIILAHPPIFGKEKYLPSIDTRHTVMLPDFEKVPRKYAIDFRNNYMLKNADFVVTYINRPFGGAAKFAEKAKHQQKTIINIADVI